MFQKNAWYVAATPDEIDGKPLGRKICNEQIVFYRGPDGKPVALDDYCPHRGAPLSLGKVESGKLICGYHGLAMGSEGKAVSMPGQRVSGFPCVQSYPVEERYGFIWVWPGDKDKADPELIHKLHWADNPDWAYGGGLYHFNCDYRFVIDNLMDLTHETYLHPTSIGQREIEEVPPTSRMENGSAITSRFMHNIMAPPFWKAALRGNNLKDDVPVDRWQICRFFPPSHVMIDVGVAHAGHGGFEADPAHKVSSVVVDFITPETETSTWYFWGMARNFNARDQGLTDQITSNLSKVFLEDKEMLERQQVNVERTRRPLLSLNIDGGGMHARKIIDQLVSEEQSTS
ncbi:aromatic ring-hydroxylating dioxygenase subunit alpha [Pusillimonas sp. NJUB218]|jgi:vanillate O-demethylase monooxygenase subunit|uniref:aromatic ring-hydroxylating dioxygenase subunit alpha n=1 Tax=Pusillimonas sp. NJUB218 TaxID=2023230 RepID=UPI000F4CF75C|nr:aromatic ring-hydroxylating dioxygenase subunit alpha [Pusillimonas sp. NJUB218]ROT45341.1 Rieske (2Fe-2S) protein [Pusillimonas sp. NJUB218]